MQTSPVRGSLGLSEVVCARFTMRGAGCARATRSTVLVTGPHGTRWRERCGLKTRRSKPASRAVSSTRLHVPDVGDSRRADRFDLLELWRGVAQVVEESCSVPEEDRHYRDHDLVEQAAAQVLLRHRGTAAERDALVASCGARLLERRLDPVRDEGERRPTIHLEGSRRWWVWTKTGWWKGGSSPHQPFHQSFSHGPGPPPNMFRPMIVAPAPPRMSSANAVLALTSPPSPPWLSRNALSGISHSWSCSLPIPSGCCRLWSGPAT